MLQMPSVLSLATLLLALAGCGANVAVDLPASGSGGTGGAGGAPGTGGAASGATASASSASSSSGGSVCPSGTCQVFPEGACEEPTGPLGNGCCACGPDGFCTAFCQCAAPDTPIATPSGEQAIASLRVGDIVFSVDGARIVAVPVVATHQTVVGEGHRVMRVRLENGATLDVSPGHPTLDGRTFTDLHRGGQLGGVAIVDVEAVPYAHDRTYDILPGSESGGYFAGGALIGSTLRPGARVELGRE